MDYRPLGRADNRVSSLCLGAPEVIITDEDRKAIVRIMPPGTRVFPCHKAAWRAGRSPLVKGAR